MTQKIGITERGDAALHLGWQEWVQTNGRPAVLITKNPLLLDNFLSGMENIIVHATITGMGRTIIEPGVIYSKEACKGVVRLVEKFGVKRVILRCDPVIPTDQGILTAQGVIEPLRSLFPNMRMKISFMDLYPHVKERFRDAGVLKRIPWGTFDAPLELKKKAWERLGKPEICGEKDLPVTGCISETDCNILGVELDDSIGKSKQRACCACIGVKTELLDHPNRCKHGCLYCYWKDKEN